MPGADFMQFVFAEAVFGKLGKQVSQGVLPQAADGFGGEFKPAVGVVNQPFFFHFLG